MSARLKSGNILKKKQPGTHSNASLFPNLGCGVGLRAQHYSEIIDQWPGVDWFEAISENYMDTGGRPLHVLKKIREHYPIVLHGTSLSIGGTDELNPQYLKRLKALIEIIEPAMVSDHLCWTGIQQEHLHDLLPLPFTEESLEHVVGRVQKVQDFIGRPMLLENVSSYVTYKHSVIPEWEFIAEVARRSGCGILLDINNIYVNSINHKFNALDYLKSIPGEFVGQFHLAGHTDMGEYLFDTHSAPVIEEVWSLYREALKLYGQKSTLIEWDENIPPFERLLQEAEKAREVYIKKGTGSGILPVPFFAMAESNVNETRAPSQDIKLNETQLWMKHHVRPEASDLKKTETILNSQGSATGIERMSVYAEGYPARIHEALAEAYGTVQKIVGENEFIRLAKAYAEKYPSPSYNLSFSGVYFPEFLKQTSVTKDFPFLSDLAQMEWQMARAFHAFDQTPFDLKQLSHIPLEDWEKAKLIFQPSVSLVTSEWPIFDIWSSYKKGDRLKLQPVPFFVEPGTAKNASSAFEQRVLIGRRDFQVRCELIDEKQFALIEGLMSGKSLGEVCGILAEQWGDGLPIAQWFQQWVQDGLILTLCLKKS